LNQSYKTVWNASAGTFVAVAENAKGRGKKSSGRKARNVTLLAAVAASGRALQVMALSSLTAAAAMFPTQAFATASGSSLPDAVLLSANGDTQQTDRVTSPLLSSTPASYVAVTGMNDGTDQAPVAAAQGAIAIGSNAVATVGAGGGIDPIAIGRGAQAGSQGWTGAIALGGVSSASNDGIAIGEGASATAAGTAAVGRGAVASASNAMALGKYSTASANNAVALGQGTVARRANTVDVGLRQITSVAAATQNTDAVNLAQLKAMGANVDSSGNVWSNFVAYDDMTMNTLTLKGANGTKITRLAAGTVAAGSTDAVNGGQVYSVANSVAAALGAGTVVNQNGTVGTSGYVIGGMTYSNVGGALAALNAAVGDPSSGSKYVKVLSTASGSMATGAEAIAIGGSAFAASNDAIALGSGARSMYADSTAISANSSTTAANTVSVGSRGAERRITNVASGTNMTDAATVGQVYDILNATDSSTASQLKALQTQVAQDVSQTGNVKSTLLGAAPVTSYIAVSPNVVQGTATTASNDLNAMAIGPAAAAAGINALAVGAGSAAGSSGSTAVGSGAGALSPNATAIGTGASVAVASDGSVSIGYNARSAAINALSLGTTASAGATSSIAIGYNAFVNTGATNSMALGTNASASAGGSLALGNGSIADRVNVVSVGSSTQQRQIVNVAAGTRNTDVVNVGQLVGVISAIGAGATVNPDGTIQQPSFNVNGQTYTDIASAISAAAAGSVDAVTYNTSSHSTVTLGGAGSTTPVLLTNVAAGAQNTDAANVGQLKNLGANIDTGGNVTNSFAAYDDVSQDMITLKGAGGTKVTGLAAGSLSASSTDAVNGSQLYQTNQDAANLAASVANVTTNVTNMSNTVNNVVNGGGIKYFHTNSTLADSSATGMNAVAIGGNASATAIGSVALGSGTVADRTNTVSVGSSTQQRQIVNVAAGTQDTDAVNVIQLKTLGAKMDSSGNLLNSFVAYDDLSKSKVSFGGVGAGVPVTLTNVASGAVNAGSSDVVNGSQLYAHAASTAAALGGGSKVNGDGTVSAPAYTIGGNTYNDVGAALAAAVTSGTAASADAVMYDSSAHDSVTLGNAGAPVRITNVAAGRLAADSSDAVNGAQLYATNQNVAQNTSDIAQNTGAIAQNTGDIVQNTTDIAQNTTDIAQNTSDIAKNTGDITNLDTRVTTVEGSITNLTNEINTGTVGLVQQDPTSRDLTVGKDTDGTQVDFTGTAGARELLGVAAGTTDGSAVNVGQLKPLVSALGGGAQINADGSVTAPTYHVQGGTQTTVGDALGSLDNGLTTLQQDIATGNIGLVTQDAASRTINIGGATDGTLINLAGTAGNRVVTGVAAGAINATSADAVNGSQLYAHAASTAVALGGSSTVNADGTITAPSYSVGGTVVNSVGGAISNLDGRVTQNTNDIANLQTTVGSISGTVANAVQYDSSAHNSVTLGGSSSAPPVKLTNLQAGTLSATSTDAVTGAQLWTTNQQVSDLTQAVQNVQTTGTIGIATNTGGVPAAATGTSSAAIGGGATASAANSVAIGQGSLADQPNTISVGSAGNERRITNVADGLAPTDAVNMRQFESGMSDIARNAYSGTASAIALTMIPDVDANKNLAIGVGTSGYKGYQAVAVGLSARVTQSLKVKLGAGISSATTTVGAGAAYQW
jgi:autotransporter adhesin